MGQADPRWLASQTLSEGCERSWPLLTELTELAEGIFFVFIFADDGFSADVWRARYASWLSEQQIEFQARRFETPDALGDALRWMLEVESKDSIVWCQANGDEAKWQSAWADTVQRWNERRERIRRARKGGVIFVAPIWAKPLIRDMAPDLWSQRELVLELSGEPRKIEGWLEAKLDSKDLLSIFELAVLIPDELFRFEPELAPLFRSYIAGLESKEKSRDTEFELRLAYALLRVESFSEDEHKLRYVLPALKLQLDAGRTDEVIRFLRQDVRFRLYAIKPSFLEANSSWFVCMAYLAIAYARAGRFGRAFVVARRIMYLVRDSRPFIPLVDILANQMEQLSALLKEHPFWALDVIIFWRWLYGVKLPSVLPGDRTRFVRALLSLSRHLAALKQYEKALYTIEEMVTFAEFLLPGLHNRELVTVLWNEIAYRKATLGRQEAALEAILEVSEKFYLRGHRLGTFEIQEEFGMSAWGALSNEGLQLSLVGRFEDAWQRMEAASRGFMRTMDLYPEMSDMEKEQKVRAHPFETQCLLVCLQNVSHCLHELGRFEEAKSVVSFAEEIESLLQRVSSSASGISNRQSRLKL